MKTVKFECRLESDDGDQINVEEVFNFDSSRTTQEIDDVFQGWVLEVTAANWYVVDPDASEDLG